MRYTIVQESNRNALAFIKRVNEMIKDGWKPLGGICCLEERGNFCQAMIKED